MAVNLTQGLAAMGQQWYTQASRMDDPSRSNVIGKWAWAPMPGNGARIAIDGFAINKFAAEADKEEMFRLILEAVSPQNMREAAGFGLPVRTSVMGDASLEGKYPFFAAARSAIAKNKPFPTLPEFMNVGEIVTRRVAQAMVGEMSVEDAMNAAAQETEKYLSDRGYYKK
jgi:multiple sugar transport system substrate-binding protein